MTEVINKDADQGFFLAEELKAMKTKVYGLEYPNLMARSVFPVDSTTDAGASSVAYECFSTAGMAKLISSYSNDLPAIEVGAKEEIRKIHGAGVEFSYSTQDVKAAQMAGKPLQSKKMEAAQRALRVLEDKIAFNGSAEHGIEGFLQNPNFNQVTPVQGAGGSTKFSEKTPDEVLEDITAMQQIIVDSTNGVEAPNTLLVTPAVYAFLASTPRSSHSDTTLLRFILDSAPYISDVVPCYRLKDSLPANAAYDGEDCAVLYDRSPDKLWLETPQDVEFHEAQKQGLKFSVPAEMRTAGVIVPFPKAVAMLKGV